MKKYLYIPKNILIAFTLLITISLFSQQKISVSGGNLQFIKFDDNDSKESKELSRKKYLSSSFKPALVYNETTSKQAILRFNIFKNEMEFLKKNQIYYLNKTKGTTIFFNSLNTKYKVFLEDNILTFFVLEYDGKKGSLLTKQKIKYTKEQKAKSSYQISKPATYKRLKDTYYLADKKDEVIKIPKRKKEFLKLFKGNAKSISKFMKKERLNHKKLIDLKKIFQYYSNL